MLNRFRNALRGVVAWIVGVLIILAMAVVGVPALDNFGGTAALSVGPNDISALDVEREFRNQLQTVQIQNPDVTREQALAAGLAQRSVETLVTRALLQNEADRLGLAAPDDVIRAYIEQIEGFRNPDTGRFDSARLSQYLSRSGITLGGFQDIVSAEVTRTQIIDALNAGVPAPQSLTRFLILREFEEREVTTASLPLGADDTAPTEEELVAYLAENQARYQSPEFRVFTVLTITQDDVLDTIEVSEDDVRQLYDARQGLASAAETRTFRQLRVAAPDAVSMVETMAQEGASFDEIAEATGAEVTVLEGQTRSAIIIDELANAVFETPTGTLAGPIATPFGTLVAEVTEIVESDVATFEDLRAELENELRAEIAEERLIELVEGVELARDEGATLAEAAQSVGLESRTTQPVDRELFTRTGSIANVPIALNGEGQRLEEGEESAAIRLSNGFGFIAVDQIIPPAPLALTDVREEVTQAVKSEEKSNAAANLEARFLALIAEGQDFEAAATELGGSVSATTVTVRDQSASLPQEVIAQAFETLVGETVSVTAGGAETLYMLRVDNVSFGDTSAADAAIPVIASQFGQAIDNDLAQSYLAGLEETTTIKRNERQLARALGQDQQ